MQVPTHDHSQCCIKQKKPFTNAIKKTKLSKRRIPLIELENKFSCSIIGTCVTLTELKKICHKAKLFQNETIDNYDLHRIFVAISEEKCYAHHRLQKLLDQKYEKTIANFSKVNTQEDLKRLWKQAVKKGDVAGAFWTLLTHPDSQEELLDKVYGQIHMLSHLSGASIRIDMQELTMLRYENKRLKKQQIEAMQKNQRRSYEKDALIRKQKKQLSKYQQEINALKVASISLTHSSSQNQNTNPLIQNEQSELTTSLHLTKSKLMRLEQKSAITLVKYTSLNEQKISLQTALQQTKEDNTNLKQLLDTFLDSSKQNQCQSNSECHHCNLEGKCILYVGGRNKQCSHFRALVEQNNGHFIHHDGGKSDGSSKLYSTLAQADIVMCPLDCISHEAMINVKRHCKNSAKPLVMMPRSSLSAFSKGLSQVVN